MMWRKQTNVNSICYAEAQWELNMTFGPNGLGRVLSTITRLILIVLRERVTAPVTNIIQHWLMIVWSQAVDLG